MGEGRREKDTWPPASLLTYGNYTVLNYMSVSRGWTMGVASKPKTQGIPRPFDPPVEGLRKRVLGGKKQGVKRKGQRRPAIIAPGAGRLKRGPSPSLPPSLPPSYLRLPVSFTSLTSSSSPTTTADQQFPSPSGGEWLQGRLAEHGLATLAPIVATKGREK
ncbi:hypothetical protein E2C01_073499 [Portunus trituberculatus]|uniref:Uncharacterized protein n=1 Tax=Portunus trituberculatus TaxID=210409 RepID=A0A5B7IDP2_PORTR|nr:hypothetical protein [Portunus trituberculatus]